MGLSDSERISMIRSALLIQYTRVTDRRTDGRTEAIGVAYTRYSIYAGARKKLSISIKIYVVKPLCSVSNSKLSTESAGSRRELVANSVHADATQLDSSVASTSAMCNGLNIAVT